MNHDLPVMINEKMSNDYLRLLKGKVYLKG